MIHRPAVLQGLRASWTRPVRTGTGLSGSGMSRMHCEMLRCGDDVCMIYTRVIGCWSDTQREIGNDGYFQTNEREVSGKVWPTSLSSQVGWANKPVVRRPSPSSFSKSLAADPVPHASGLSGSFALPAFATSTKSAAGTCQTKIHIYILILIHTHICLYKY